MKAFMIAVVMCALLTGSAVAQDVGATGGGGSGRGGTRIAGQVRLDALNIAGVEEFFLIRGDNLVFASFMPFVTGGLRLDRLFLGLGLGFYGYSDERCDDDECTDGEAVSASGFGFAPIVTFDLISERDGALYLLVLANFRDINGGTVEDIGDRTQAEFDGVFQWGANLGGGVKGNITEGLAIGTEWGWGFITWTENTDGGDAINEDSYFVHGLWGSLMFEASVGL